MDDLELMSGLNKYIKSFHINFLDTEMNLNEKNSKNKKDIQKKQKAENHLIVKEDEEIIVANEYNSQNDATHTHKHFKSIKELEN